MDGREIFCSMILEHIRQIDQIIDQLCVSPNPVSRNKLLTQLRKSSYGISVLMQGLQASIGAEGTQPGAARLFTLEELSSYDGKNGRPAYVAVSGVVYDVTDSDAWAGGAHFGLPAGKDLTKEFSACHAGRRILSTLQEVGKLAPV